MFSKYYSLIKETLSTRSNIEWSAMFIGFASIWMSSGFFAEEEVKKEFYVDKESTVRIVDQISSKFVSSFLLFQARIIFLIRW